VLAQSAVHDLGEKGVSDGIESDSNNLVYVSNFEQNGLNVYNPANASVSTLVRDPRIGWTDAIVAGSDGFLYFTENQLWRTPSYYPDGGDRTVKPFVLFRIVSQSFGSVWSTLANLRGKAYTRQWHCCTASVMDPTKGVS